MKPASKLEEKLWEQVQQIDALPNKEYSLNNRSGMRMTHVSLV